jgi:hypothetical protein
MDYVCEADHPVDKSVVRLTESGMMLCSGCIVGMRRDLKEIWGLHFELKEEAVHGTGPSVDGPGFVTGTRAGSLHPAMKYNSAAFEAASQIEHDIMWNYAAMRSSREGKAGAVGLEGAVRWLQREQGWIAGSSFAVDFRNVLRGLIGVAVGIIDPAGRPVELGVCIEMVGGELCTGTVRMIKVQGGANGNGGSAKLRCDTCGFVVPVRGWARYGKRVAKTVNVKGDML